LAEATKNLFHTLFEKYGLVILDGDDVELKKEFAPYMKAELLFQKSHQEVQNTIAKMKPYDIQVNPREINLFYIEDDLRERIVFEKERYKINNTTLQFSEDELLELLEILYVHFGFLRIQGFLLQLEFYYPYQLHTTIWLLHLY
jgi:uncharacterized protein YllA (UPF0747 family)